MRKTLQFSTLVLKDMASLVSLNNKCTCVCCSNLFLQKKNLMDQQSSSVNVEHGNLWKRNEPKFTPFIHKHVYTKKKDFKFLLAYWIVTLQELMKNYMN